MPEHVYLTSIPDSTARLNRQRSSQGIFLATWSCLVPLSALFLFCKSFQSKIPTQRKHTLSAPARPTVGCLPGVCLPPVLAARQKSPPETPAKGKLLTLPPTLQKYVFMVI